MITVYNVMLVTLGFLLAALMVLFVMPAYRRRIERFATERIKRALPLSEAEIRADKDRLRAEFATEIHKLQAKLEEANISAARQSIEINRREARIHDLTLEVETQKASVEENENARRVLEQAIMDRLPKVELRLTEARRMLQQRDDELAQLAATAGKQNEALEQATQINAQLANEVSRLKTSLETRAARNRDAIGDPRFDGEVALRSEIETLRAKSREQAQLIERLQAVSAGAAAAAVTSGDGAEIERLSAALTRAEAELSAMRTGAGASEQDEKLLKQLEEENRAHLAEIAKLKAALEPHESTSARTEGLSAQAEADTLRAEVIEKDRTIQLLRAEVAASAERLTRQAQHFRDELRRLSSSASGSENDERRMRSIEAARRSLAARISEPRVPKLEKADETTVAASGERNKPYLKAVNGGAANDDAAIASTAETEGAAAASETKPPLRRSRLLDRISNIDKS